MDSSPAVANPVAVDVDREHGVALTWEDDHVSRFTLEELRMSCPCAQCRGLRQTGEEAWPRPGAPAVLRIESAELVGNWGLNIHWNDTHTTGIYSWETLLSWCTCERCEPPPDLN